VPLIVLIPCGLGRRVRQPGYVCPAEDEARLRALPASAWVEVTEAECEALSGDPDAKGDVLERLAELRQAAKPAPPAEPVKSSEAWHEGVSMRSLRETAKALGARVTTRMKRETVIRLIDEIRGDGGGDEA
jgi:ATP-dependent exoDNAse (exonuclease V) beta subunit